MGIFRTTTKPGKSSQWAFMQEFHIPNFDTDEDYLVRYRIIQTPFGSLFLHRIGTPDSRPVLHDHPWAFLSIVVRGRGYTEVRFDPHTKKMTRKRVRRFNIMRRDDAHYIERLHSPETWTLMLVGVRRRTWGYWEPVDFGGREPYVPFVSAPGAFMWTEFSKHKFQELFDDSMARRAVGRSRAIRKKEASTVG